MSLLNQVSFLVTPNANKASKLYAVIPTNGNGEMTVVRATTATRINSAQVIESVASSAPRIDYTSGGCPSILVEPQRTNLIIQSATPATQTIAVVSSVNHILSFYGEGIIALSGAHTASLEGTGATDRVTLKFTTTSGSLTLTVTGTVTNAQLEIGSYVTSYIPTTIGSATRNIDDIKVSNIFTNGLITLSGGTLFVHLINNINMARDASTKSIGIDTSTNGLNTGFSIKSISVATRRLSIVKIIGTTQTNLYDTLTDTVKIAITWNGATANVHVNGATVVTGSIFTITAMQFLFFSAGDFTKYIKQTALFPTALTTAQCNSLTTL